MVYKVRPLEVILNFTSWMLQPSSTRPQLTPSFYIRIQCLPSQPFDSTVFKPSFPSYSWCLVYLLFTSILYTVLRDIFPPTPKQTQCHSPAWKPVGFPTVPQFNSLDWPYNHVHFYKLPPAQNTSSHLANFNHLSSPGSNGPSSGGKVTPIAPSDSYLYSRS